MGLNMIQTDEFNSILNQFRKINDELDMLKAHIMRLNKETGIIRQQYEEILNLFNLDNSIQNHLSSPPPSQSL